MSSEGLSDQNPIRLDGISSKDFRALLKYMFPQVIDPSADSRNLLTEEWISILKLSTMWNMVDHRKSSIQNLRMRFDYDPVTRVVLAQSHGIDEWLLPAYLQPAHRKEPLSALESSRLGYETAFKIVEARERAYSNMLSEVCNACADKFSPARSRIAQTHAGPFGTLSASTSFGVPRTHAHPITTYDMTETIKDIFGITA
ncbi:unnamed protein product [Somion occarium]|uniref:BTB domain-containing protein n=1 Tax=Somion occarium TaxID=3059160 RepID=A0ABP1D977_9APHY